MSLSRIRFDGAFSFALMREITCSTASYGDGVLSTALRKGQNMYFNQIEFGKRIKELRNLKGITQEELAEELNITYEHMNKIERAKHGCSIDLILEMAAYFEVSTDYLLTGIDYTNMVAKKRLLSVVDDLNAIIHAME